MVDHPAAVPSAVDVRPVGGRAARIAVGLAAAVIVTAVVAGPFPDWLSPPPDAGEILVHAVIGAVFVAVGLFAWQRRPHNRVGQLMVGVGLTSFVPDLYRIDSAATFTLAASFAGLHLALLGHLLVVFPQSRAAGRYERLVIGAGYASVLLGATVGQVFWSSADHCFSNGCPANLLLLYRDHELDRTVGRLLGVLGFAVAAAVLALVVRHWCASSPAGQRALTPVLCVAVPIGLAVMAQHVLQALMPWTGDSWLPVGQVALCALPLAFLFGLARSHLDRAAVGRLVTELDGVGCGERLSDSLARALHDPTVTLAFPLPGQDGLVDDVGRPVRLPDGDGQAATPLRDRDGTLLALLVHDASLGDQQELIESVAAAARLGLANERLRAHLHAQLQDVRASRARLAQAAAQERRRLERDLHDGAQQYLVTLGAVLALARTEVDPTAQPALAASLDRSFALLGHALQDLRTLARGLWPPLLNEAGLGPALLALTRSATVPTTTDVELPQRLPPLVEATAYFVVAEALTNVAKHAGTCTAHLTAACRGGVLAVAVTDRGRGGADPRGSGLRGLADRVAAVNGTFTVRSAPGAGTELEASIPCG